MLKQVFLLLVISYALPKCMNWYYKLSVDEPDSEYDFVVVGGGTTGNVVANRLTEIPNIKVLVIEAGGEDSPNPLISVPFYTRFLQMTSIDWRYKTTSQNHSCKAFNDQQSFWPRGKVLGGTSSLNFMIYARGSADDFDHWERAGATGWGYKDVLPYFMKSESHFSGDADNIEIDSDYHGKSGPLKTTASWSSPLAEFIFRAFETLGLKSVDYNGKDIHGFSVVQTTIFNGMRVNSASAFLRSVVHSRRDRLHILTNSHVRQIVFEKGASGENEAVGVIYVRDGKEYTVRARKEVIVSAGAVGTPHLLMLSGLGPENHIERMNVKVIADLPGVGSNLQDHIMTPGCFKASNLPPDAIFRPLNPIHLFSALFNYLFFGTGPLTSQSNTNSHAFMDSVKKNLTRLGLRPDLQFVIVEGPLPTNFLGEILLGAVNQKDIHTNDMKAWSEKNNDPIFCDFMIFPTLLHPLSTGSVRLKTNRYLDHPDIDPNYLAERADVDTMIEGLRLVEKLEQSPAFNEIGAKLNFYNPECGSEKEQAPRSSAFYECFVRHQTWTVYHPVGTAKMGPSTDPMSVVDPRLSVHKVKKLRVADASVMPELTSANTQAPCYMIGEKAADMIKEDWKLL